MFPSVVVIHSVFIWVLFMGSSNAIQHTDTTWVEQIAPAVNSLKFTARNGHAACVFKNKVWVTGGRTDKYTRYNLKPGYKTADVWWSSDGVMWTQESYLLGDFFAQNSDATQPGPLAPWYPRFGHTLTALDVDGNGSDDLMVQLGGFAPTPSNDVWVTEDGVTWVYCGQAPWSGRAWHSAVVLNRRLYVMGGTPLNNDVWYVDISSINKTARTSVPLTRAFYTNYTYTMTWTEDPFAPWSPRCGFGAITQFYFNETYQTLADGAYRVLLVGGYGGWLDQSVAMFPYRQGAYDGIRSRNDVWSMDGNGTWTLLNDNATFPARAWAALSLAASVGDPRVDLGSNATARPPRVYVFGGGYIGFSTSTTALVGSMDGKVDAFFTRDGVTWRQVNYQEGGGTSPLSLYSSQEWAKTTIEGSIVYVGLWGMTVLPFDSSSAGTTERRFLMVAGDQTGKGGATNLVFRSTNNLLCELSGVTCSNRGTCTAYGCECLTVGKITYSGEYCDDLVLNPSSAWRSAASLHTAATAISAILLIYLSL